MSEKNKSLIEIYEEKVSKIPKKRFLSYYPEEIMLLMLKNLEQNHSPNEKNNDLINSSLKAAKGCANPLLANEAIVLWKKSKRI